jgi:predicted ester cyclase
MSLDENKALMRQWTDGMNRKDPGVVDETCAPDWGSALGDYAFWKGLLADWFAGFPDGVWAIDEMIAEGESVATAYTFTGTNTGEFQGRAPTGKKVSFKGIWIDDIKDGKFVGTPRGLQDRLAWMTELGMVTPS